MRNKKIRVGINGFGRIGRNAARIILDRPDLEIAAINSRAEVSSHAYLLKYDSSYGMFGHDVKVLNGDLSVKGKKIAVFNVDDPASLGAGKS
jgi:glyceraldehyde 3-phosphate dehydrogenase